MSHCLHPICRKKSFRHLMSFSSGISPGPPDEAFARGFTKRQPELDTGNRSHKRLMNVLDRLDEMRLPQDEFRVVGLFDLDGDELHESFLGLILHCQFHDRQGCYHTHGINLCRTLCVYSL